MMKRMSCAALVAAFLGQAAIAASWNPYAKPADEFEQRLDDAAFGVPGADRAFQGWLAAHPELALARRMQGYDQLCRDYGNLGWNKIRAGVCAEYARLKKAESGDDDEGTAAVFADQPPARAVGSAKVPLTWNRFGCQSIEVTVNGVTSSWFVDTGAEITILTRSLADRMGVRRLGTGIRVGTTTADVSGKAGIVDRLRIGSAYVENVPVLILPDAQLKPGNMPQIDGILGLQVMVAFGRIAWVDGGSELALGETAPKARPDAPRIYWDDEGVGVPVRTSRGILGAFLDTGANVTDWRQAGFSLVDPRLMAAATEKTIHVGGAGGVVELKQRELQHFRFDLGDQPVQLDRMPLAESKKSSAAKIGMDIVSQFGTFILDFEQMRMDGILKKTLKRE
jgi:predicted aspartyl protease